MTSGEQGRGSCSARLLFAMAFFFPLYLTLRHVGGAVLSAHLSTTCTTSLAVYLPLDAYVHTYITSNGYERKIYFALHPPMGCGHFTL